MRYKKPEEKDAFVTIGEACSCKAIIKRMKARQNMRFRIFLISQTSLRQEYFEHYWLIRMRMEVIQENTKTFSFEDASEITSNFSFLFVITTIVRGWFIVPRILLGSLFGLVLGDDIL
jgi:hypothetical protein